MDEKISTDFATFTINRSGRARTSASSVGSGSIELSEVLALPAGYTGWQTMSLHAILSTVAGDRWLDTRLARGKSEHQKAACLVKSRALGMQIPGDGKCHRKYTAQHYLYGVDVPSKGSSQNGAKVVLGKVEKAG